MNWLEIVKCKNSLEQRTRSKDTQDHWPLMSALKYRNDKRDIVHVKIG